MAVRSTRPKRKDAMKKNTARTILRNERCAERHDMTSHPEIAGARCECPACRIERLEAELAEAKAKIIRAENIAVSVRWYMESFLSTLESATAKPTNNGESAT